MPTINQLPLLSQLSSGDQFPVYSPVNGDARRVSVGALIEFLQESYPLSAPVTKTADFTLAETEGYIINNKTGSACVVTLPAAASYVGRAVTIKTIQAQAVNSASSNVVPRSGSVAGTAILSGTAGNWAKLVSDGSNWVIMAGS